MGRYGCGDRVFMGQDSARGQAGRLQVVVQRHVRSQSDRVALRIWPGLAASVQSGRQIAVNAEALSSWRSREGKRLG